MTASKSEVQHDAYPLAYTVRPEVRRFFVLTYQTFPESLVSRPLENENEDSVYEIRSFLMRKTDAR